MRKINWPWSRKTETPIVLENKATVPETSKGKSNSATLGSTVVITASKRFGVGLDEYMAGVKAFENVKTQQRVKLYDIYLDILTDPHLSSVIQKRKSGVLSCPIEFRKDGVADETVNEQIASPWFLRLLEDALDANTWGDTLVQFYINEKGWVDYFLVPRKHVDSAKRIIKAKQGDTDGESFDSFDDLLLIQGKDPLGVLSKVAPYVIYKRGAMGDWAQYSELFGMPIRKYTFDAADPDALAAAQASAEAQGAASIFFCPDGCNLELIESGGGSGSSDLYGSLIDRCNAEISKAVLGNTLTTEASDTGTQALGTVQAKGEQGLIAQDKLFILNLLNYDMTDQFAKLGINTEGGEFVFVEAEDTDTSAKAELLEKAVTVFNLPVADDYLYEQLHIEKPENYEQMKVNFCIDPQFSHRCIPI